MGIRHSSALVPALELYNPRLWLLRNPPSVTLRGARPELVILNLSLQAIKGVLTVETRVFGRDGPKRIRRVNTQERIGRWKSKPTGSELPRSEEKWRLSRVPRLQLGSGHWISKAALRPPRAGSQRGPPTHAGQQPARLGAAGRRASSQHPDP